MSALEFLLEAEGEGVLGAFAVAGGQEGEAAEFIGGERAAAFGENFFGPEGLDAGQKESALAAGEREGVQVVEASDPGMPSGEGAGESFFLSASRRLRTSCQSLLARRTETEGAWSTLPAQRAIASL